MSVTELDRWLTKRDLAEYLGCSTRSVERCMAEEMPHRHILGAAKFRLSEVETWLEENGKSQKKGRAA